MNDRDLEPPCNPDPRAPHGFNRNASHNAGRYVCDCEGWTPHQAEDATLKTLSTDEQERVHGYTMQGNTKVYCCYGMYCDAGHTSDCRHAGVAAAALELE